MQAAAPFRQSNLIKIYRIVSSSSNGKASYRVGSCFQTVSGCCRFYLSSKNPSNTHSLFQIDHSHPPSRQRKPSGINLSTLLTPAWFKGARIPCNKRALAIISQGRVVVEVARVELASESISTGFSPSAVNDLEFRFGNRPLTGFHFRYLVAPC